MCQLSHVRCHMSGVTCQVSYVICNVSHVTSHLSPVTKHTATATVPLPANSPVMHTSLVCKKPKNSKKTKSKTSSKPKNVERYVNISDMLFNQKSPDYWKAAFPQWQTHTDTQLTDIAT